MNKKLVVARYNENIDWLNGIEFDYIVYNKGSDLDMPNIKLPNIGREAHTYLHHIIHNYAFLDEFTVFCQGDPIYHCKEFVNKVNNYTLSDNVEFLADWIVDETLEGHPWSVGLGVYETLLKLKLPSNINGYHFAGGAQFIVPKSFILNKSIDWWKFCYEIFISNENSPWIFERLWPYIFLHTA